MVDYFVNAKIVTSREDAVHIGRALGKARVFAHVARDHEFKDEYLFYRFAVRV